MGFLFRFSGRIGRLHWNLGQFLILFLYLFPMLAMVEVRDDSVQYRMPEHYLLAIFALGTWINLAVSVQRLHDRDKSGFWLIPMLLIPGGFIWMIIELGFLPGTPGPNRFGPPPGEDVASLRKRFRAEGLIGDDEQPRFDMEGVERAIAELKARRAETMHRTEAGGDGPRKRQKRTQAFGQAAPFGGARPTFGQRA